MGSGWVGSHFLFVAIVCEVKRETDVNIKSILCQSLLSSVVTLTYIKAESKTFTPKTSATHRIIFAVRVCHIMPGNKIWIVVL